MLAGYGGAGAVSGRRRGAAAAAEPATEAPGEQVLALTHDGALYPSPWENFAPYLAEFFGSFLLTLTFIYNYAGERRSPAWTSTANGFMVTAIVYAFGHVSGANLNPAISVSLMLIGRYKAGVVARLCFSQMLGAICAALVRLCFFTVKVNIGPTPGFTWAAVCSIELLYSAMIVFVYLNCAASIKNNPLGAPNGFVGLAVGCCFIAGGYAAREVMDPIFNSAIAVGLSMVEDAGVGFDSNNLLYIVADLLGAFLGAGAYRIVRPDEDLASERLGAAEGSRLRLDGDTAKVAAEFFGTFFIILTKALNRTGSTEETRGSGIGPEAWSVAAAITAMVYALRGVSGAHFNPAVTLAAFLSGRLFCPRHTAIFYVLAQFTAAVTAGSLFAILNHGEPISLKFGSKYSWEAVGLAETAFTFLVAYMVLASTVSPSELAGETLKQDLAGAVTLANADVAGLAYGACQSAGGFAAGQVSGAMLNPAVIFAFDGINLIRGNFSGGVMIFIFYQVFGAVLAAGFFMVTHAGLYRIDRGDGETAAKPEAGP